MKEMGNFKGGFLVKLMKKKCWHDKAKNLFYNKGLTIVDIERTLNVTRKTISVFLQCNNPKAYKAEKERRKAETEERTKEAKKRYANNNPDKVKESQIKFNAKKHGMSIEDYKNYMQEPRTLRDELRQQHEEDVNSMSTHGLPKSLSYRELSSYYRSAYRQTRGGNYRRRERTECGAVIPELGLPKTIMKRL